MAKILIVDDVADNIELLEYMLADEGYEFEEPLKVDGLRDEIVDSGRENFFVFSFNGMRGQCDDGKALEARIAAQSPCHFLPIDSWQRDIY